MEIIYTLDTDLLDGNAETTTPPMSATSVGVWMCVECVECVCGTDHERPWKGSGGSISLYKNRILH